MCRQLLHHYFGFCAWFLKKNPNTKGRNYRTILSKETTYIRRQYKFINLAVIGPWIVHTRMKRPWEDSFFTQRTILAIWTRRASYFLCFLLSSSSGRIIFRFFMIPRSQYVPLIIRQKRILRIVWVSLAFLSIHRRISTPAFNYLCFGDTNNVYFYRVNFPMLDVFTKVDAYHRIPWIITITNEVFG